MIISQSISNPPGCSKTDWLSVLCVCVCVWVCGCVCAGVCGCVRVCSRCRPLSRSAVAAMPRAKSFQVSSFNLPVGTDYLANQDNSDTHLFYSVYLYSAKSQQMSSQGTLMI